MNRRDFLAMVSSGVAASSSMSVLALPEHDATIKSFRNHRREPNVVLMICDDLGYGDLGCYGSNLPTSNLNAIAVEGLRCRRFNASHPNCSASRAGLLTGRYGTRSGTTGAFGLHSVFRNLPRRNSALQSLSRRRIQNQGHRKVASRRQAGIFADESRLRLVLRRSLQRGYEAAAADPEHIDPRFEQDTDRKERTRLYTEEAIRYIEEQTKAPFFLYLAYSYPHDPVRASECFQGKTRFGHVGDSIAEIDWSVGEVIMAVEKKGLASDTLVIFTSDHGLWYQGNPDILRGRKVSTFEGGFRVPFLANWSGVIGHGRVVDEWCSNLDVLPTLCTICGLKPPPKPLDGADKTEVLIEGKPESEQKPILYFSRCVAASSRGKGAELVL